MKTTESDIDRALAEYQAPVPRSDLAHQAAITAATPPGPTTAQLMRARAEEEALELDRFVAAMADTFGCPSMFSNEARGMLTSPFREVRHLAQGLNAQAARRGAPLGQPTAPAPVATGE